MKDEIIVYVKGRVYISLKDAAEIYNRSIPTLRLYIKEMERSGRYDRKFITLDGESKLLINSLALEDFLSVKTELKNKNLSRRLPPYDPAAIRKQRGEYQLDI